MTTYSVINPAWDRMHRTRESAVVAEKVIQMSLPTETEAELLHHIIEEFWKDFSKLANETINRAPLHLRSELEMRLNEKTSIYGRNT